jgi:hypothetical protein
LRTLRKDNVADEERRKALRRSAWDIEDAYERQ